MSKEKDFKRKGQRFKKEVSEFEQSIVEIARVTRVMAGGKRLSFRACVVIGDRKGRVGMGLAKAKDVPMAVQKAVRQAEKNLIKLTLRAGTIAHEINFKYGAARIMLKPAPPGTGIISGGAVRTVLELVGIENAVSKIFGTNNKVNNVKATIKALAAVKKPKMGKVKEEVTASAKATAVKEEEIKEEKVEVETVKE
jgi:small subunit ribosomal protein S5